MSDINLFLIATRESYRYPSARGELTTEDLWDLPLTARNGFSLNNVAISINTQLKELTEESFVSVSPDPQRIRLANQLEILKQIIAIRKAEAEEATKAAEKAALRNQIREAIANRKQADLNAAPIEELEARLAELEA